MFHSKPFIVIILILLNGCAAVNNNYFQDGKPSGKNNGSASIGLCVGSYVDCDLEIEDNQEAVSKIEPDRHMSPLLAFQIQGGPTEHADAGLALGIGMFSFNARLFSKICLLDRHQKLGIALLPAANLAFTPDTLFNAFQTDRMLNTNLYLSLPISLDLSDRVTFIVQPTYGYEWMRKQVVDENDPERKRRKTFTFTGRGLAVGMKIHINYLKVFDTIHPEVSFISYNESETYVPYVGIGFSIANFDRLKKDTD